LAKLGYAFQGIDVAKSKDVTSWYRCNEAGSDPAGQTLVPQVVEQDKAGLEIAVEENSKHFTVRLNSELIPRQAEKVVHRVAMKLAFDYSRGF